MTSFTLLRNSLLEVQQMRVAMKIIWLELSVMYTTVEEGANRVWEIMSLCHGVFCNKQTSVI